MGVNGTGSVKDTMLFGVVKPHTGITWTSSLSPVWFSFIFSLENKDCEIKVQGAEEAGEAMNIALIVVGEYFIITFKCFIGKKRVKWVVFIEA